MSHNINRTALREVKQFTFGDRILILQENLNQDNAGNVVMKMDDFLNLLFTFINVGSGITNNAGTLELGGQITQDTLLNTNGNGFQIESEGATPNIFMYTSFSPQSNGIFGAIETDTAGTVAISAIQLSGVTVGFMYKEDIDQSNQNSIAVNDSGTLVRGKDDLITSTAFEVVNHSLESLFQVLNDGKIVMEQIVPLNFTDDTAAALGNVPIGGIYHNAGALRIRLT